ncbi:hypothetical protein FH972_023580 [Carpinus fangiana]|uniref:ABC-type xenobiotic transporter n=1 Tax=Carpinus fangiana TaxID=176857 RepID=A0A5N6KVZ3_9ROSI|nr:hypothetical protein FH972_023580 [Carpinus fangiana]
MIKHSELAFGLPSTEMRCTILVKSRDRDCDQTTDHRVTPPWVKAQDRLAARTAIKVHALCTSRNLVAPRDLGARSFPLNGPALTSTHLDKAPPAMPSFGRCHAPFWKTDDFSSQANRTTVVQGDKPSGETFRVVLELLATLGLVCVNGVALTDRAWGRHGSLAATAGVITWTYTLVLVCARLVTTKSTNLSFPTMWYHTAWIYGVQWASGCLLLRSYIIHPPSGLSRSLMIAGFSFNSLLWVIALASRKGNKAVQLEYEGNIPPAREPVASIFSLATFSWVDSIVWTGYKKSLELDDVWNIAPTDKAAYVVSNYRQVKKTSALAWHLLSHFKGILFQQAMWSCLSGLLTFMPTLLLRAILLYVEHPDDIPANSAWFFVILLFVSGCASALADGLGLWIGRKICIRLRAVIIGELYGKALKRKVGLGADATLGENKKNEQNDQSWWERLLGKKKDSKQDQADQAEEHHPTEQVTSGAIINLMAVDSYKVSEVSAYLHFLWASTPIQVIMAVALLYQILGYSSIAGIGMMVVLLPVNMVIARQFANVQMEILGATDARIRATNEVLTNIRIIKFFAWEQRFMDTVNVERIEELKHLRWRYVLWSLAATVWVGAPMLISFLSFAVYTLVEKKALVPSIAFTALSLFQILRIPLDQLADMIAHVQEAKVSVDRIQEFLNEEDTQKYTQLKRDNDDVLDELIIGFEDGHFTWASKADAEEDASTSFRMMDLNLRFAVGQLNVVAGATGSGKTSLLMALLGEMTCLEGSVYLPGGRSREDLPRSAATGLIESVAYCAQQAWLVNDTVKQNIVFASPWDAKRYQAVVRACALQKDFEILDLGDGTWVGEKGVTLSGGQKQRISLARALYSNARHVLLDDILSAVDSHTAKWIFEEALIGPLMANRTCILVTHNISLCLPQAQFAVVLDNGRVAASGTATEVINSGQLSEDLTKSTQASKAPSRAATPPNDEDLDILDRIKSVDAHDTPATGPMKAAHTAERNGLEESKAIGSVKISIIVMYLKRMGPWWYWVLAAVVFVLQQVSNVSTNVWIRQWANAYSRKEYIATDRSGYMQAPMATELYPNTSGQSTSTWTQYGGCLNSWSCTVNLPAQGISHTMSTFAEHFHVDAVYYLAIYGILSLAYMAIAFFRESFMFYGSIAASKKIHLELMEAVSRAKFRFFDSTPLGQIMNRFSKDMENIDQEIAPVAVGVVHCLASILTIVILISVITPGFLIAGVFISVIYFFIGKVYIGSSRDLKRIESVQRSPLYQQFGETLSGMATIRAYGDERRFIRENLHRVNTYNRPFLYLWAANRWLAFRVDIAGALVSFFTGAFVILSVGKIDAGAAGLAMSYAVTFTENVLWFVRLYATNEQNMNSVERVKEYLDVEQEAAPINPENRPAANWPSRGTVEFINYTTRYREDFEPVLRELAFQIAPCEKVGVVGRTGAGKSSLALALFRALEAEKGKILVDGVDIGLIGLQDLRENIVMVPQDPTLFSGTIRSNLDPFNLFTDEEIFTALRRVQLVGSTTASQPPTRPQTPGSPTKATKAVSSESEASSTAIGSDAERPSATTQKGENKNIFLSLSSAISESGSNLSQGQRQLLCLARALLKAPRVLLMDEATASIDYATDAKIQETIRELRDNTIITIAHRLKTIVDYDKVMVMERGRVVEMGAPWELLKPQSTTLPVSEDTTSQEASTTPGSVRDPSGKRWFYEMCETSGELEVLMREAKKSWDAKRLVDVDES